MKFSQYNIDKYAYINLHKINNAITTTVTV